MDAKTDPPRTPAPAGISLVRGGPFFCAQQALGLIRPNRWNLCRRIAVLIGIGWLPLFLITAVSNPRGLPSLFMDYRVHARLLVALPALLIGEVVMDSSFRAVFAHLRQADLLDASDMAYMDGVIAKLARLRDAFLPELVVLAVIIVKIATSYRGLADSTPWLGQGAGADYRFTVAGWYAVLVSAPLWNFLMGLGLWRWLLWTFFAFTLSTRHLRLVVTHADKRGGLSFLGLTISAFAPIAFAATSVIGATWRYDILRHGAQLVNYEQSAIVLALIFILVPLGPLLFFVPRLVALRRRGVLEYGILAQLQSTEFHDKWILHRAGHEADFLLAPEINSLTGFNKSYENLEQLKPFPADMTSLYELAAAVAVPTVFVLLTEIPLSVVLRNLFKALR